MLGFFVFLKEKIQGTSSATKVKKPLLLNILMITEGGVKYLHFSLTPSRFNKSSVPSAIKLLNKVSNRYEQFMWIVSYFKYQVSIGFIVISTMYSWYSTQ